MGHVPHRAAPARGPAVKRIAILGNAGGTTARSFGVYYPDVAIDGVEIDPEVNAVAKKYFGLRRQPPADRGTPPTPGPFLQAATEKYDLIFIDAYRQPYVPFYLATADFFKLCRDHLAPDGIVALNVSTVPGRRPAVAVGRRHAGHPVPAGHEVAGPALQPAGARLRPGHRPR